MPDVMFYEVFEEEGREIKRILPKDIQAGFTSKTIQGEGALLLPAPLISVRTQSRIPLDWSQGLKGILTRSQGYYHVVAFHRESKTDIDCGFLGDYCSRAVAEQAALMMMFLLRKLKKQENNFISFSRDGLTGLECKGRKALVVGVGNIGKEIVDIARGLRMAVKGVDIVETLQGLDYVTLSEGMAWAEVVFCALSLTEKTDGMLNYRTFEKACQGVIFVNIARGEISPVEDLKKLLDEGKIAGIGLDVYPQECLLADSLRVQQPVESSQGKIVLALAKNEKVLFTPHNAFNTKEALGQKASLTVAAVVSYLKKGRFPDSVPIL
ncbi:MAG: hydroxyacid dehydrogenase [Candidatus Omnitrophica bacterium]|nr:hydroxyacid dehydrogenase [Candidatus Omnitrophota bacterium]